MAGEKTEKATPKKKQDERKKGNVFFSREVIIVVSMVATFYCIKTLAPFIFTTIREMVVSYFTMIPTTDHIDVEVISHAMTNGWIAFAKAAMPAVLVSCLVAIIFTMAQTRMLFSPQSFKFKGERINPISGLKKMFSLRSLVELLKSVIKIIVLIYVIYSIIQANITVFPRLSDMDIMAAVATVGNTVMDIVIQAGILFVVLAAADYLYQWWQFEKNMRMSKQEIKDEYKQIEGDPQIKGKQRSIQQERSRRRMMQNVPSADVVIRNPTHYAVAIKYQQGVNRAPVVIAKGADSLALKIIKVAQDNDVFITENKPLARALYAEVKLDQEIPDKFYQAIAEVLAFVYTLKKKDLN